MTLKKRNTMKYKFKKRDIVETYSLGVYNISPIFKISSDGEFAYVDLLEGKNARYRREKKVHVSTLTLIEEAKQPSVIFSVLKSALPISL